MASSPASEMPIDTPHPGWAEQDPAMWWEHLKRATADIKLRDNIDLRDVDAVGISYQMHGLVIIDAHLDVLRPAIIWCDSRAVDIGETITESLGKSRCLDRLLNFPGNFTASKLAWVRKHEPGIFKRIFKAMLPGEYIAMRLTGEISTTSSGLSEGVYWDFRDDDIASMVLDACEIPRTMLPDITPVFSVHGAVTASAASELGLRPGVPVSYVAGDQPNNAFSLGVLSPGEIAATAGTSGVIYGVTDKPVSDPMSRVNTFVHVTHQKSTPRYGVLLCINGTGISYRWLRAEIIKNLSYDEMNSLASTVPIGSDGLTFLPYGNGAERTLGNREIGASFHNLKLNIHTRGHLIRAVTEGIVFALNYGLEIMSDMGMEIRTIRAGKANMFLSPVFRDAFANTTGVPLEIFNTDGAIGAARGAGLGAGIFRNFDEAFIGLEKIDIIEPDENRVEQYHGAYYVWRGILRDCLRQEE